jgi:hypothetical protein
MPEGALIINDRKMRIKRQLLVFLAVCLSYTVYSYAQSPTVTITNNRTLNFGVAVKPVSGTTRVVVNRNSSLGAGTTATMLNTSALSSGRNLIRGSSANTIQIAFTNCASNSALGLNINTFVASYGGRNFVNSAVGLRSPRASGRNVTYGATLVIQSSSATGSLSPCYNIDVNYD